MTVGRSGCSRSSSSPTRPLVQLLATGLPRSQHHNQPGGSSSSRQVFHALISFGLQVTKNSGPRAEPPPIRAAGLWQRRGRAADLQ